MSTNTLSVRIGLSVHDPIRLEGLLSLFDEPTSNCSLRFLPIACPLESLLRTSGLQYLIADLSTPQHNQSILNTIRNTRPDVQLIVLGPHGDDVLAQQAILAGARAYISHSSNLEEIRKAIDTVAAGRIWAPAHLLPRLVDHLLTTAEPPRRSNQTQLTEREIQIMKLLKMAYSNREIAEELGIEERTVKNYVSSILRKTGAENRTNLVVRSLSHAPSPRSFPAYTSMVLEGVGI